MINKIHHIRYYLAYRFGKFKATYDLLVKADKLRLLLFFGIILITCIAGIIILLRGL